VVAKQTHQTNGKHYGDEEQEQDVEATHSAGVQLSLCRVTIIIVLGSVSTSCLDNIIAKRENTFIN